MEKITSFVVDESQSASSADGAHRATDASNSLQSLHSLSTLSKSVIDAELLWALKCVDSHYWGHSNMGMNKVFQKMFGDSQIAANYSMSESKFRYVTSFGLGPLFYDV